MNVCISVYIRTVCECWWPEALGPLELKLHGCESPDIGAGKHTQVLCVCSNPSHICKCQSLANHSLFIYHLGSWKLTWTLLRATGKKLPSAGKHSRAVLSQPYLSWAVILLRQKLVLKMRRQWQLMEASGWDLKLSWWECQHDDI